MFKFIHAADIHLDSKMRGLHRYEGAPIDLMIGSTRRALENLVDLAIEEEVNFLLIAGDIYDGDWKDFSTGLFFVRQMAVLRKAQIPVFFIRGNHDAANRMTKSLPLPDNVRELSCRRPETVELESIGVAIHGQGFAKAAVDENVVPNYPLAKPGYFNIGMLHTSLDGESVGAHARYAPCTLSDLENRGYDYWALGHIHQSAVRSENPLIVYSGNIQGRHIGEAGPRGCMLVECDSSGGISHEMRTLDVNRWLWCRVNASDAVDLDEVIRRVGAEIELLRSQNDRPLALRVEITGSAELRGTWLSESPDRTAQIRSIAIDIADDIWIEKIKFIQDCSSSENSSPIHSGAVSEVMDYIRQLRDDREAMLAIGAGFSTLKGKVPADVFTGSEQFDPESHDTLTKMLDDVEAMLSSQLSGETF